MNASVRILRVSAVLIVLVLAVAAAAAGSHSTGRCLPVSPKVTTEIAAGLSRGGKLTHARAVRSRDFHRLYFVAAHVRGQGIDDVAVWATNRIDGYGIVMAVDRLAVRFSDWPDGSRTDARISLADDGAVAAIKCVR